MIRPAIIPGSVFGAPEHIPSVPIVGGNHEGGNGQKHPHTKAVDALENINREETEVVDARRDHDGHSQAQILLRIAQTAKLFHDPAGTPYADVTLKGHRETLAVRGKNFKMWLTREFFSVSGAAPNSDALAKAISWAEASALIDGDERPVFIRIGHHDGKTYLDLADDVWRAVEITANGWRVVSNPPVRFRRTPGMRPLPAPQHGGSIDALRPLVNVKREEDYTLLVAWLIGALAPAGPYPLLAINGEQGSGKTRLVTLLRNLIDPNAAPTRAMPRDDRNAFISASNSFLQVFDNLSAVTADLSDTLCRIATGGGFATRALYTDGDEVLIDVARPILLNGIGEVVGRPDLMDRAINVALAQIEEGKRRTESELKADFERSHPLILGALLDAVVVGLRRLPEVHLTKAPRMADFARWVSACEPGLWEGEKFLAAYNGNRATAVSDLLDADIVAAAIRRFMRARDEWCGTASLLLSALNSQERDKGSRARGWPELPKTLSDRLRRLATAMRANGIDVAFSREGHSRQRLVHLRRASASAPPAPSAEGREGHNA